jgi:YebC/PmpR family DNA-binding regulatory protein
MMSATGTRRLLGCALQHQLVTSNLSGLMTRRMFAGHNKWSKIRHKKGAKDAARAGILGKASRAITAASRDCNGDHTNLRLQSAIQHAKSVQLPKERIQDAIAKATSKNSGTGTQDLVNLRFDAMMTFGQQKVACIITALTDNRNRSTQNVRHTVTKAGGEFLPTDKLAYIFHQVGLVLVENVEEEDALFECALEAGATNVEAEEDDGGSPTTNFVITTDEKELYQVVTALQADGYELAQFEHRYVLVDQEHGGVDLSEEGSEELDSFLEKMDENEDVNNVYHNVN